MAYKDKKIAFLFPGQGAQYIGMAQDFNEPVYTEILAKFKTEQHVDLAKIMQKGPEELLKETKYTQPAILFHSIVAMKSLQKRVEIIPDLVAGHSLGEFSALVANGVITFEDALYLVHKRGEFMIKANGDNPYAMAAIMGLSPEKVKELCLQAEDKGTVIAANFNTPVQTVISGSLSGVERASALAGEQGAKVVPLVVGGPFHSPLIARAAVWLEEEMQKINFQTTSIPVVCNVDAQPETDPARIKEKLSLQVVSSVLWVDSMNYMLNSGTDIFIEFGPKGVLAGMMRKIDRKATIMSIDTTKDLDAVAKFLEELT